MGLPNSNYLAGRLIRLPLRLLPKGTVMPVMFGPMRGGRIIVGASDHGTWMGTYEGDKVRSFAERVRPGQTVYDLGAHIGYYTLLASRLVGPDGRVIALEPEPQNLRFLRRHLQLNRVTNVEVVEAAVTDSVGEISFEVGPTSTTGKVAAGGVASSLAVRCVTIDDLVLVQGMPAPDLIKMDIEGAEGLALRGAEQVFARYRPTIFLATHNPPVHRECIGFLEALDYQIRAIDGASVEESSELLATHDG